MKARDLAAVLLDHPDLDVVVWLVPLKGEARTLTVYSAGRTALTDRIALRVHDPEGQLEIAP
jgi:hypothetical protein